MSTETILVIGATGNMGTAAITAGLRNNYNILAIIRSSASKTKLLSNLPSDLKTSRITFATADVTSPTGVQSIVDQVRTGQLPEFHHVWASVGAEYTTASLLSLDVERIRRNMTAGFEANLFAYLATMPYLLSQPDNGKGCSWTLCTGSQGDLGTHPLPAMTQGPLFSFAVAAARECEGTGVRFCEVYLGFRVEVDAEARAHKVVGASHFSRVYGMILRDQAVKGARVRVERPEDMEGLRWERRF
ncbi:hypothetical protein MBLNU230_g4752t1 [Neophaeotheca triangularis]